MINKFLEHIKLEKRYSPNTLKSYSKDLSDFQEFFLRTEGGGESWKADKKVIRNFMVSLSESGISKRSINRKLSTLRSFFLFLLKIGEIKISPTESIPSLKFYPEKQIPLSQEEMENFHKLALEPPDALSQLIIETLYQTGMRKAELCNLLEEDANLETCELRITGKGNKVRLIPISPDLAGKMQKYRESKKPLIPNQIYFFVNHKGKKLGEKFVYSTVNRYLGMVTAKKKKSPHILRHSFATHILDNGAEISKVKKLLGHSSLASTQVYTQANIEQLKKVFNSAHPRAIKKE